MQFKVGDTVKYEGKALTFASMEKRGGSYNVVLKDEKGGVVRQDYKQTQDLLEKGDMALTQD